jgi:esterase/lipase superfamily enzyme
MKSPTGLLLRFISMAQPKYTATLAVTMLTALLIGCVEQNKIIFSGPANQENDTAVVISKPGTKSNRVDVINTGSFDAFLNLSKETKDLEKIVDWNYKYQVVKVSFATNRKVDESSKDSVYTADPGDLSYGFCYVTIPKDHVMGEIEAPSFWRLEFSPDPEKHVVVLNTEKASRQAFFDEIAKNTKGSGKSNAFVFVHGFNVTFEEAAQRTAQMAYDLQFDGVPIFFSWPSNGTLPAYTVDERNIEWAEPDLKAFLMDVLKNSKADNVYVIGHSMGTRALTRSIAAIGSEDPKAMAKLKGIILAAPDIDAVVFKRDIAPKLLAAKRNVTLYASSNDRALMASKKIHGYQRAGETGTGLVVINGMDTIDASSVDSGLVGHSYFGDNRSIISDMYYLLKAQLPPSQRSGLASAGKAPDLYWMFKP